MGFGPEPDLPRDNTPVNGCRILPKRADLARLRQGAPGEKHRGPGCFIDVNRRPLRKHHFLEDFL